MFGHIMCCAGALLVATTITCSAAEQSGPYEFANTFIQTPEHIEGIRDSAKKDMKSEGATGRLTGCIRNMESFQLELNADISMLKGIHLGGKLASEKLNDAPQQVAEFFELERDIYREMGENCAQMVQAPKPGADYGAMAANAPKLTARLEYLDSSIFKLTPIVFATLIRQKPDAQNHMNHLSITRAQMNALARSMKLSFGKKLDMKTQNYTVSAASTLYFYLVEKGYKGSDEP